MAILWVRHRLHVEQVIVLMPSDFASATGLLWTTHHELLPWVLQRASHPQDGLVVNFYIPHNRWTPLQAEEALGIEMGPRVLRLEGASVGCAGCRNSQPTRPADET
jgi:hypothetical protein